MSAFPSIKLKYMNVAGRAEQIRLALYIGGVPFEDNRNPVTFSTFETVRSTLPLGQYPVLVVDGEEFTQSHAMLRYAGRLGGLYPTSSPFAALKIDEVLNGLSELEEQNRLAFFEKNAETKKAMREELARTTIPRYATLIEARLAEMKKMPLFQSADVFVHEVNIYVWVKSMRGGFIDHIPTTVLDGFKLINETFDKVASHPKVKEWYSLPHDANKKLKLTYLPLAARGEPIRLAFFMGGVEFEDVRVSEDEWAKLKPTAPFNQLPILEVDGEVVSQSFAILRYAGILSGLYPSTDALAAYRIDELLSLADDLFNYPPWIESNSEKDPAKQLAMRKELATGMIAKTLGFLEKRITAFQGPYATGKNFTVADLGVYSLLAILKSGMKPGIPTTIVDAYPSLQRVYYQVLEHPKIKEYYSTHPKLQL